MPECDVGDRFVRLETFFEFGDIKSMLVPISNVGYYMMLTDRLYYHVILIVFQSHRSDDLNPLESNI